MYYINIYYIMYRKVERTRRLSHQYPWAVYYVEYYYRDTRISQEYKNEKYKHCP